MLSDPVLFGRFLFLAVFLAATRFFAIGFLGARFFAAGFLEGFFFGCGLDGFFFGVAFLAAARFDFFRVFLVFFLGAMRAV